MDFSDEQIKEFMQNCQIEDFGKKQQAAWIEKGGIVRTAIQFLALGSEVHPGLRACEQVMNNAGDIEKVRKDWADIERSVNRYFEMFRETLAIMEKAKGREHGQ